MTLDFAPLYRSTIGFDHLASLLDSITSLDRSPSYPPYNIELVERDKYRITMAVAGFVEDEIVVEVENGTLTVSGRKEEKQEDRKYLHRGIAERNFQRRFKLENHVKVVGAALENGLLHVDLVREIPEAMKPRRIAINGGAAQGRLIESSGEADTKGADAS